MALEQKPEDLDLLELNEKRYYGRYPNALVIAIALFAGGGGSGLYRMIDPPREDPFTGSDGEKLELRLTQAMEIMRLDCRERISEVSSLTTDIAEQQDIVQARLLVLEREIGHLPHEDDYRWRRNNLSEAVISSFKGDSP